MHPVRRAAICTLKRTGPILGRFQKYRGIPIRDHFEVLSVLTCRLRGSRLAADHLVRIIVGT